MEQTVLKRKGLQREAGMSEQAVIARTHNGFYNNFAVIGRYSSSISPFMVYLVLRKMVLKFSFLTANYDKDSNMIFPVTKLLFSDVFESRSAKDDLYEELLNEIETYRFPHNEDKPLFKVLLINRTTVAAVFDHAVLDGVSGMNFHKVFLSSLNSLTDHELENQDFDLESNDLSIFDLSEQINELDSFPLSTEKHLNYVPDFLFRLKRNLKSYLPQALGCFINDHRYSDHPSSSGGDISYRQWPSVKGKKDFGTIIRSFNISPDIVRNALGLCRSKGVTLTPFLEIIMCQTLCKLGIITESDLENERYFIKTMHPSDLRRFLSSDLLHERLLGLRVYPGIFNYPLVEELLESIENSVTFWKLIQISYENLSKSSADPKSVVNQWYALNEFYDEGSLAKMIESSQNGLLNGTGPSIRLSNIGLFRNEDDPLAKFSLENALFTQSLGVNGGCVIASVASTEKGGMNICCSCMNEKFNGEAGVEEFTAAFKETLLGYAYVNK
jgi:hypothetical protein